MTIITLPAVRKRSFGLPVHYETSDFTIEDVDTLIARNSDTIIARNGDTIVTHRYATLGTKQILKAEKRSFTLPTVVVDG